MPAIVPGAPPWLRIEPHRIYAVGGSMGGQEALLLLARHSHLLAGVIAFDAPTDMALRYRQFPESAGGGPLQQLAVEEVGATPARDQRAWAVRSPLDDARADRLLGRTARALVECSRPDRGRPVAPECTALLFDLGG